MTERIPSQEFSEREQLLIAKLRENGTEDLETHELLLAWCEEKEIKATQINTSRAGIELDLKKGKLYRAAGFREEAWASLEAVRQAANNEDAQDLLSEADALMDEMDSS